jgi:beta-lactamase class A
MSPRSAAASAASDRAAPTAAAAAALRTGLEGRLRAAAAHALRGGGEMGVALAFLPTGERVRWNADALFPTASVIKVAIVAELFAQAAEGRVALDTPVRVIDEALVAGSGVLSLLSPGVVLPLRDLATLAIAVSDNTASNLVLAHVGGPDAVNARMHHAWGLPDTTLHRPIRFFLGPDDPPFTATGTPDDQLRLLTLLAEGRLHDARVSDQVLRLMGEVRDGEMLPRFLPVNPYAAPSGVAAAETTAPLTIAHKTGAITGVRNDVALIRRGSDTLAICVFTRNVPDDRWTAANAGCEAAARVGKLVCDHFFGGGGTER